jgi:alcohol dehydrogenase class IV
MVTGFEFGTAARIVFGAGRVAQLPEIVRSFGPRLLVVTGSNRARVEPVLSGLRDSGLEVTCFGIENEPDIAGVQAGVAAARAASSDAIVCIGGGSVIDGGKAIAALATNQGDVFDYLEVIGKAMPLARPALPIIAVPTTAGTGAEVTRNAVLHSPEHRVKVSLRSPHMFPRVALVDPELTLPLPPNWTASTGLDALTQLIEPFVCRRANPLTDALCREGIPRVARSLRRAYERGDDLEARSDMALASLFGGLALANAGLGAVHGFAAAIGGRFPIAHGTVCAALLPHVMEANARVALEMNASDTCQRYDEVARLLTGDATAQARDGIQWVLGLCQEMMITGLSGLGIAHADFVGLVQKAQAASSMKPNPVEFSPDQLERILERAF